MSCDCWLVQGVLLPLTQRLLGDTWVSPATSVTLSKNNPTSSKALSILHNLMHSADASFCVVIKLGEILCSWMTTFHIKILSEHSAAAFSDLAKYV